MSYMDVQTIRFYSFADESVSSNVVFRYKYTRQKPGYLERGIIKIIGLIGYGLRPDQQIFIIQTAFQLYFHCYVNHEYVKTFMNVMSTNQNQSTNARQISLLKQLCWSIFCFVADMNF